MHDGDVLDRGGLRMRRQRGLTMPLFRAEAVLVKAEGGATARKLSPPPHRRNPWRRHLSAHLGAAISSRTPRRRKTFATGMNP